MHERPRRVLLVEDDQAVGAVVEEALSDEGHEMRWARNGAAALAELADWTPDLIVLDVMMPVMDGRGFRAAQRQLPDARAEIPVVVLSGAHDAHAVAEDLGAVAAITKPFRLEDLIDAVARYASATEANPEPP
jgi:two-component system, OmpR family, response regulator MprA